MKTVPVCDLSRREDVPALRALWQQCFGDTDDFLDSYFSVAYAPERCCVVRQGETILAMAHWFPCTCRWQSMAYAYAVATAPEARGQGHCAALMAWLKTRLESQGLCGLLLVPGSKSLFAFYARMGYISCCPQGRMRVSAAGPALPLKPVSPRRYGELRRSLLPPGGVLQEGLSLDFQAGLSRLYAGKNLLLAAQPQEDGSILACELLCEDPISAAPRILKTLKAAQGIFRAPYPKGRPFAMFLAFASWQGPPPSYFAFAFD